MRAFLKKPLVIATLVACLCGLLKVGQPIDHAFWNARFRFTPAEAPQSIVLATTNDPTKANGLSNDELVQLLDVLVSQAPKKIYFDHPINFSAETALAQKIRSLGSKVSIVVRAPNNEALRSQNVQIPDKKITGDARIVYSGWYVNFMVYAQGSPSAIAVNGKTIPAFAVDLADSRPATDSYFIPKFSVDPDSIRSIPAGQLIGGKVAPGLLTGRSVIISSGQANTDAQIGYFGHGRVNPVALDIAGAASVSAGRSININDLPLLLVTVLALLGCARTQRVVTRRAGYLLVVASLFVGPAVAQEFGYYTIPSTSMIAVLIFAGLRLWGKWRQTVIQTSASGLPNFVALTDRKLPQDLDLVVAAIGRYEEFLATLPSNLHAECANQIARRFAVGSGAEQIFHGENGHFAWIEHSWPTEQQNEHFEGMRALFSAPLLVGGHMFDTNVHFGLDRNYQHDTVTRLNTAITSANEALKAGRTIQQFEASRLADAPWELSLLARIDEGMKNGDIWLAYQPQWDYREGRVSGAEALVRWNDPVRGPIRPDAFIVQAEKAGRIDALTFWVFEEAITAAQAMRDAIPDFQMSINLSAQLVDKPSLLSSVSEIVRRRGIDCRQFTIEVTETAAVYNRPAAVQNLQQLRSMGFRLAIDDFGTGESSLLYLAELPSDELKIDQHFVSRIITGERERQIVNSTIKLAHALKQSIVAEGIEDRATFDLLGRMGCDTGQGYFIGRPESFDLFRAGCIGMKFRGVGS